MALLDQFYDRAQELEHSGGKVSLEAIATIELTKALVGVGTQIEDLKKMLKERLDTLVDKMGD